MFTASSWDTTAEARRPLEIVDCSERVQRKKNAGVACPSWVIHDRGGRRHTTVYVRFAPKATKMMRCREMTRCAMSRHMAREIVT
jgi:hypothetical protein